jgi:hypothetical protein
MPRKYFVNKSSIDIQDRFEHYLLINKNKTLTKGEDCVLELVFTEEEIKQMIPLEDGFFVLLSPIPISRVKGIIFWEENQMQNTITNIEMSTAFVPKQIIKVEPQLVQINAFSAKSPEDKNIDWSSHLKKFDSLLGGFALMRLAGEDYMNYSENYFSTLSAISETIKEEYKNSVSNRKPSNNFFVEQWFKNLKKLINKQIEEQDVKNITDEEKQQFVKNPIGNLIDLDKLSGLSYIAAVMYQYKVGQEAGSKKIDSLIKTKFQDVNDGEKIALCYGLNRGYYVFNNKYKDKIVKFQLNSKLDYYTVESLYQYVFHEGVKSNNFPYLDSWCPQLTPKKVIGKTNYMILDVTVIGKKKAKVLSKEYWTNLLPSFLQGNKFTEKTLPQIYQELGEVVYNDAKDEIADEYENQIAQKQEEIENLKAESLILSESQSKASMKEYEFQKGNVPVVAETQMAYNSQKVSKDIFLAVLKNYRNKKRQTIEKEAKKEDISFNDNISDEELIWMIVEKKQVWQ